MPRRPTSFDDLTETPAKYPWWRGAGACGADPDSSVSRRQRADGASAGDVDGVAGGVAAAGFFAHGRARQACIHCGNPRRFGAQLLAAGAAVSENYRADLEDSFFQ